MPIAKTKKTGENTSCEVYYIGLAVENKPKQYFRLYKDSELGFCGTIADGNRDNVIFKFNLI